MCGRFVQVWDPELNEYVMRWLGPDAAPVEEAPQEPGKAWNVCPTENVGVLVEVHGDMVVEWMRWGIPVGNRPVVNTRVEGVVESKLWGPLMEHRVVVPMQGFYEWLDLPGKQKQPYYFHSRDAPLMVAALHALREVKGDVVPCVSILTGPASPDVKEIHDRQPVILADDDVHAWLDPDVSPEEAVQLTNSHPGCLVRHAVARDVGRNTATGARLIEPVQIQRQNRLN